MTTQPPSSSRGKRPKGRPVLELDALHHRDVAESAEPASTMALCLASLAREDERRQRSRELTADLEARGYDADHLGHLIWLAVDASFGHDPDSCYEDGYRRDDHLWRAARKKIIAAGAEAVLDHGAIEGMIWEAIDNVFEEASMASWVGFNGGGNGEELDIARAHSQRAVDARRFEPRPQLVALLCSRRARARQPRGRGTRRRGSRRGASSRRSSSGSDDPGDGGGSSEPPGLAPGRALQSGEVRVA